MEDQELRRNLSLSSTLESQNTCEGGGVVETENSGKRNKEIKSQEK